MKLQLILLTFFAITILLSIYIHKLLGHVYHLQDEYCNLSHKIMELKCKEDLINCRVKGFNNKLLDLENDLINCRVKGFNNKLLDLENYLKSKIENNTNQIKELKKSKIKTHPMTRINKTHPMTRIKIK